MGPGSIVSAYEGPIRLAVFLGLFVILAASEYWRPRRPLVAQKSARWFTNLAIVILDSLIVRLIFPAAAVGIALWAANRGYGLFNVFAVEPFLAGLISIFVLDFAVWLSHVASHKVPIFWRVHRMHHSDRDFDVTTAIRFHPIEIVLSMVWKAAVVIALGAPAVSVILFEIILNGGSMFNHSNLKLPLWLDRIVRMAVVTPDMHRVHHSTELNETDSNYGFSFSFWDRIFGTYVDQPKLGHDGMQIGIGEWQTDDPTKLGWTLFVPFIRQKAGRR